MDSMWEALGCALKASSQLPRSRARARCGVGAFAPAPAPRVLFVCGFFTAVSRPLLFVSKRMFLSAQEGCRIPHLLFFLRDIFLGFLVLLPA